MNTDQAGTLEAILQELRRVTEEIRALRRDLRQTGLGLSPTEIVEPVSTVGELHSVSIKEAEEAFLSIFDWLSLRNITVKNYKQQESTDAVFDQLATFIGERFDSLRRVHDQIRRNLSTGSGFTLNLSSRSQEEIANSTQLCTSLYRYAFLSSYRYNKDTKVIYATPQRVGRVINFFTGGWFERFVFLKVTSLLSQNALEYVYLMNPQISLPNGDDFELDLLFLIKNEPLWLECKTGDYQSYIAKYSDVRPTLTIPKENSILIILGIPDDLTSHLTDLYNITVANENNFLAQVAAALNLVELPRDMPPPIPVQPGKLSTLLNKAGLRPVPEVRSEVIEQLIRIMNSMDQPKTLVEIKSILADRVQTSKSKLQNILTAIVRSGCLLDEQGEPVSFSIPSSTLISHDADVLEQKCIESYAYAVMMADPTYFDDESKRSEFEQVTGGKVPDTEAIDQLKRKAQTSHNTV